MNIRPLKAHDQAWAEQLVCEYFGSPRVVSRGTLHDTTLLPGLVAELGHTPAGLLQYHSADNQIEVITLISAYKRAGVGTSLMRALRDVAYTKHIPRIWLTTTTNNDVSQQFYKNLGLRLCAYYPNAMTEARKLKPELPTHDEFGTPIRDEVEFEWLLTKS